VARTEGMRLISASVSFSAPMNVIPECVPLARLFGRKAPKTGKSFRRWVQARKTGSGDYNSEIFYLDTIICYIILPAQGIPRAKSVEASGTGRTLLLI
jgi:hypothetical protein